MYTNLLPSFSKRHMACQAKERILSLTSPYHKSSAKLHTLDRFTTYHSPILMLGVSSGIRLNSSIGTLTTYRIRKTDHKNIIIQF